MTRWLGARPALHGLLVAVIVGIVALGGWIILGARDRMPPPAGGGLVAGVAASPVLTRDLVFTDQGDGTVMITDAATGAEVAALPRGEGGFVRVVLRGLVDERLRSEAAGVEAPFRLTRWSDGRLSLADPATGRLIALDAFGPTNAGAFARFLDGP